jgi:phosphoserine phosphatase RsbU/P
VIRWGLLIFVGLVVWQNSAQFFHTSLPLLEPFGFAAFLSTRGYVAARSALRRDRQLKEIQKELEVAPRIQLSILPREFSPLHELPSSGSLYAYDFSGWRSL